MEILIKGKEIIQEPDNPSKREKEDIIPDEEKQNPKKHLHPFKIRDSTLVIPMRRIIVPMIPQMKPMVVRGTCAKNIKMKRMNNSLKILLK